MIFFAEIHGWGEWTLENFLHKFSEVRSSSGSEPDILIYCSTRLNNTTAAVGLTMAIVINAMIEVDAYNICVVETIINL